jgi:undecaprenyl diphosphate synthase
MAMQAPLAQTAPAHVAVIMDGNRRWAALHGLPVVEGYRRGAAALREMVRAAIDGGVGALTVYGFSTENWGRSAAEVAGLMRIYAEYAASERAGLVRGGVRIEIIGDIEPFALPARAALRELVRSTRHNSRLTLNLALNYSGRAEILRAAKAIAADVASGALKAAQVDEAALRARMYAPHIPDPDLLIRTGGDLRVSNFLLYQLAYTELVTLPVLWPEFTPAHFADAVRAFTARERRFGG